MLLLASLSLAAGFSGANALEHTRRAVAFGPRPPGSAAIEKLRGYIAGELKKTGCDVTFDRWDAVTPTGTVAMSNVLCRFAGTTPRALVVSGHYDTKAIPMANFVGANDGGSSTGFLLELARVIGSQPRKREVILVFFDGEEAFGDWSATNGIYGSRHLSQKWAASGFLTRIDALINVDMIGDSSLNILNDANSSPALRNLVWKIAKEMGYGQHFEDGFSAIEDDHMPFRRMGVEALDLIDFEYGPLNQYWHTSKDTLDKLSAKSFEIVGRVVAEALRRLDK